MSLCFQYWSDISGRSVTSMSELQGRNSASQTSSRFMVIESAFWKTGVWPFNADFVTLEMMAQSKETSCESHLPVAPPTPNVSLQTWCAKLPSAIPLQKGQKMLRLVMDVTSLPLCRHMHAYLFPLPILLLNHDSYDSFPYCWLSCDSLWLLLTMTHLPLWLLLLI